MKITITAALCAALVISVSVEADCINNQEGQLVCGKGQCEADEYGKIFCAEAGGGAMRDESGKVQCGVGYCARDELGHVFCSKKPGESAAVDSYGKVKCVDGCDAGSEKLCREAR